MSADRKRSGLAINLLLILVFLVGVGLLVYPTFSDWWNQSRQTKAISNYQKAVSLLTDEEKAAIIADAHAYNDVLAARNFSLTLSDAEQVEYEMMLNPFGNGMMGYVEIPKIGCYLPIYHGTNTSTLSRNIGHLEGTSLPVGGAGTHAVLSGHRGLTSARLFTDLDLLAAGDVFMVHVLDETYTYLVDQILTVLPEEISSLAPTAGDDFCTLVTCTPYGVNSHRMLVRGHRIDNSEVVVVTGDALHVTSWVPALCMTAVIFAGVAVAMLVVNRRRRSTEALLQRLREDTLKTKDSI